MPSDEKTKNPITFQYQGSHKGELWEQGDVWKEIDLFFSRPTAEASEALKMKELLLRLDSKELYSKADIANMVQLLVEIDVALHSPKMLINKDSKTSRSEVERKITDFEELCRTLPSEIKNAIELHPENTGPNVSVKDMYQKTTSDINDAIRGMRKELDVKANRALKAEIKEKLNLPKPGM